MAYTCTPEEFRAKMRSIGFGASAMPTRKIAANEVANREARWEKDIPAYKRLRADGLQPPSSEGAAVLESRAVERHEVEGTPSPAVLERLDG